MIKLLQSIWSCPNNDKFTPGWIRLNVSDTQIPTCQCRTCLFLRLSNWWKQFGVRMSTLPDGAICSRLITWASPLCRRCVGPQILVQTSFFLNELIWWTKQSLLVLTSPYTVPTATVLLRRWWCCHLCRVDNKFRRQALTLFCSWGALLGTSYTFGNLSDAKSRHRA